MNTNKITKKQIIDILERSNIPVDVFLIGLKRVDGKYRMLLEYLLNDPKHLAGQVTNRVYDVIKYKSVKHMMSIYINAVISGKPQNLYKFHKICPKNVLQKHK